MEESYYIVDLYFNGNTYLTNYGDTTGAAITADMNGGISSKVESGEMVKQLIAIDAAEYAVGVEGKSSNFKMELVSGKTKITSADKTEATVTVCEGDGEISFDKIPIDENGIAVFEDNGEYVIADASGAELGRTVMEFSVSFVPIHSKHIPAYTNVKKGSLIVEPEKPEADGYIFEGWYTDESYKEGTKWDFNTNKVTEAIDLYAKWTKKTLPQTKSVTAKNKSSKTATIIWKKVKGAQGYEVKYSTSKKFTAKTSKTVKAKNKLNTKLTKLKKGKTYYVKVRAYKKDGTATVYGKYSAVKKVKITK